MQSSWAFVFIISVKSYAKTSFYKKGIYMKILAKQIHQTKFCRFSCAWFFYHIFSRGSWRLGFEIINLNLCMKQNFEQKLIIVLWLTFRASTTLSSFHGLRSRESTIFFWLSLLISVKFETKVLWMNRYLNTLLQIRCNMDFINTTNREAFSTKLVYLTTLEV